VPLYKSVRPSEPSEPKGQRAGDPPGPPQILARIEAKSSPSKCLQITTFRPSKFSGLPTALGPSYHVVVEKSDGLNFHAKQIAHANVLILVDVEGGLVTGPPRQPRMPRIGPWQVLAATLTLSQPGGADYAHPILGSLAG
jgi:hypothetical protein